MNTSLYKLAYLFFLSSSAGYSLHAMNKEPIRKGISLAHHKEMKEIIEGIQGLPRELKLSIISLALQSTLGYRPSLWKTVNLPSTVTSASFSRDGKTLLTKLSNARACLWSLETGKVLITLKEHTKECTKTIFSLVWNPTKKITSSRDRWDKTSCLLRPNVEQLGISFKEQSTAFPPLGGSSNERNYLPLPSKVLLENSKKEKLLKTFQKQDSAITLVECSPDEKTVVTGSRENRACLWKLLTGFESLTQEQRETCFEQFKMCYSLLGLKSTHGTSTDDASDDGTRSDSSN